MPRPRIQHFECTGGVKLDDGRFGGSLVLDNARFELARDQELSLRRITTPELCFTSKAPERGLVVLSGATVENLVDRFGSWPRDERTWLAGFRYQRLIHRGHFSVQQRLQWLAAATPEYAPEPYEQLASVYRNSGEDLYARAVLLAKQRRRRETLPLAGKVWGYLQDWTVAYGYRPGQAALWMALLWASGALLFSAHPPGPLKAGEAPDWNAALYTLDLLLPVISFGQDSAWNPHGAYQWLAAVLIMLGWVLATTVAAGATRLLRTAPPGVGARAASGRRRWGGRRPGAGGGQPQAGGASSARPAMREAERRSFGRTPLGLRDVTTALPLFPLNSVLFPGLVLPLNVFEQRYRALIRDLLALPEDAPRRFGVVAIRDGRESAPSAVGMPEAGPGASDADPTAGFGPDPMRSFHTIGCIADASTIRARASRDSTRGRTPERTPRPTTAPATRSWPPAPPGSACCRSTPRARI